jgi:hypothetical protein
MVGELILSAYFTIGPLEHCPNWGKTTQVKGHGTAGMAGVSANDSPILRPQPPKIAASSLAIVLDVADIRRLLLVSWVKDMDTTLFYIPKVSCKYSCPSTVQGITGHLSYHRGRT